MTEPQVLPNSADIEKYKKAIEWMMDQRSSIPIGNQLPEHAAALYELFFKRASREVSIFCNNLHSTVFDNPSVLVSFLAALKKGIKIRIVLQENPHGECLSKAKDYPTLQVKKANEMDSSQPFNFCVKDQESYRFENDKNTTEAFAKMHSPEEARRLLEFFETAWNRASSYATS